MAPRIKTNVTGVQGGTQKIGGITRVQDNRSNGKVGGFTKAGQTSTDFSKCWWYYQNEDQEHW